MKKTLIINGSPRPDGNTAALISQLKKDLDGEVTELSAYRANIAPCVDCRRCRDSAHCVVDDDMSVIYNDDFDNVVLASPVYYCTLPGQVLSLMSRFQSQHAAIQRGRPIDLRPKKAGLILTAGGKGNEARAEHHIWVLFKMMGARGYSNHRAMSLNTDKVPACEDMLALSKAKELAIWLNGDVGDIPPDPAPSSRRKNGFYAGSGLVCGNNSTARVVPIYSIIGYSGSGKTTLLVKLIAELKARGLRVAAIKHDAHEFDIDHKGKDSWRFTHAGADVTAVVSSSKTALIESRETPLDLVLDKITDVDIILTEGYKAGDWPKIAVWRKGSGKPLPVPAEQCLAVVTDVDEYISVPRFDLEDISGLTDYLFDRSIQKPRPY